MVAAGLLLVLIGFALIVPRGAIPGATAHRNVSLGMQRVFTTPGYKGGPLSRRRRLIQVILGLVSMAGGMLLIASTG